MRASLFVTCLGDVFFPDAAADALRLLRSLGVEVDFPARQSCCGQPAFNAGHLEVARGMAGQTRDAIRGSRHVVLPSGSCTAMIRRFSPRLLEPQAEVAPRVWELSEFIVRGLEVTELGRGLQGTRVAYHHGCHALRELGLREEAPLLLERAGAELVPWEAAEECCGFGGLFAVKLPEVSVAMADRKLDTLPPVDVLTSADPGCLLQLGGRMGRRGGGVPWVPLATLLWRARSGSPRDSSPPSQGAGSKRYDGAAGER